MRIFGGLRKYRWFVLGVLALIVNLFGVLHGSGSGRGGAGSEAGKTAASTAELVFTGLEPVSDSDEWGELHVRFSALVDSASAPTFIEVNPKVDYRVEPWSSWNGSGCQLVGAFLPGAAYTITLRQGLKATNGSVLPSDITRTAYFPDRPASIAFHTTGHYLSTKGNLLVPVTTVNLRKFTATVERVYPNNLVYFAMRESGRYPHEDNSTFEGISHEVGRRDYAVNSRPNQAAETFLDLKEFLKETPSGAFNITIRSAKGQEASHLVVVTDTGIAVKLSERDLLVWANSIHTMEAVTGAEVRVFSSDNQEILHGVTDSNGLVRFEFNDANAMSGDMADHRATSGDVAYNRAMSGDMAYNRTVVGRVPSRGESDPFLITVAKSDELSYLRLDGTRVNDLGDLGGRPYLRAGYEAYLFTDRGIYRPGETTHLKAVVRGKDVSCPPAFPVQLHVMRPDGKRDRLLSAVLDEYGAAEFTIDWADYAATGAYKLLLKTPGSDDAIGSTAIAVEEFVPPQIVVKLDPAKARVKLRESLELEVSAMHLFGRPAAGNPVSASVEFVPEPFTHPHWSGYVFGDPEKGFKPVRLELGKSQLDADGHARFAVQPPDNWRPPCALKAVMVGTVMETGGRTTSAYGSSFVDLYPFYIGLKPAGTGGALMAGQEQRVAVAAVRSDGAPEESIRKLNVTLQRISWATVLKRDANGRYAYESEKQLTPVLSQEIGVREGIATAAFTPQQAGQYLLSVRDPASESSSSITFFVGSPDQEWVAWSMETPDHVDLQLDRQSYLAGDEATLAIKAPFAGKALLTIESDHVIEQRVLLLEKNTAEVKIPVRPEYRPNIYCSVSLIRPVKAGEKWAGHRAVGTIPLVVESPDRRLNIRLTAPREMRPKERLSVALEVTSAQNVPVPAEVVIAAVDEGICTLTDFACPDPVAYFWAKRALGVELFDLYSLLMPEVDESIRGSASEPGGDSGAMMLRKRLNPITARRFKPVALWSSTVKTGTDGKTEICFDVPEFTGQLRLMAVAIDRERFGSAQQSVLVKRPLVVRSSLPRFLAPADLCRMPVQIFNETGQAGDALVQLSCNGLETTTTERRVTLKNGESGATDFELTAGEKPGVATVSLLVTMGTERYAEDFEIAVRPATGLAMFSGVGAVAPGANTEITLPADWLKGTEQSQIWCSGLPGIKLGGGLEYLLRYPHGCIEQTTSSAFPLLYLTDLAAQLRPGSMGREEVAHFAQSGIQRILSMQLANGGFSLWPHSNEAYEWGSVYATHFLAEAIKAGYPVPKDRLTAASGYLQGLLSRSVKSDTATASALRDDLCLRSYACLALALAGKPEHGWVARLSEQKDLLDSSAQLNVAGALAAAGKRKDAAAFLAEIGMDRRGPATREVGGCLNSSVRNDAVMLATWLEIEPGHRLVPALVQRLEKANANGCWYTTQENAVALLALGKYCRQAAAQKRPFAATIRWHSGEDSKAFTQDDNLHLPLGSGSVSITNSGPGTLYYYWRSEGIPAAGWQTELDHGIRVRRRLLDLNGQVLNARRFKQGDLIVVEVTLDAGNRVLDNVVVEDLLPAGLEIENANLKTSQLVSWLKDKPTLPVRHSAIRDDHFLIFTGGFSGQQSCYYAARAVTVGAYVYPAVTASCMYDPEVHSIHGGDRLEVE